MHRLWISDNSPVASTKGEDNGFLKSIKSMVEELDITASKSMDILKIPTNERAFYIEKLKEMN